MGAGDGRRSGGDFQSHAGSIEAWVDLLLPTLPEPPFNPTLVRLRPASVMTAARNLAALSIPRWFD